MLYLAPYIGSGTRSDPFRPRGVDRFASWGALDLRPDSSVADGYALVSASGATFDGSDALLAQLAETKDDTLGAVVRTRLANRLSLTLDGAKIRNAETFIKELVFGSGKPWRSLWVGPDGYKRVCLRGELWAEQYYAVPARGVLVDPSDDFNRADENPLSGGGNWSSVTGWASLQVVSHQCGRTTSGSGETAALYTGFSPQNDQFAEITMAVLASEQDMGPLLRWASASVRNGYYFLGVASPANLAIIAKFTGGSFSEVSSEISHTWAANDIIRGECNGTALTLKANGSTVVGPTTDASYGSGYGGIFMYTETQRVSLFSVGDLGGGSITFPYTGSGGMSASGTAARSTRRTMVAVGGISSSGAAATSVQKTLIASGGMVASGAAPSNSRRSIIGAGGMSSSGAAAMQVATVLIGSGGLVANGSAARSMRRSIIGAGGLVASGAADVLTSGGFEYIASGGVLASGVASWHHVMAMAASGGILAGGSARVNDADIELVSLQPSQTPAVVTRAEANPPHLSFDFTNDGGEAVLMYVEVRKSALDPAGTCRPTSVTYAGDAMTELAFVMNSALTAYIGVWLRRNAATGTHTVTVTVPGTASDYVDDADRTIAGGISLSGLHQQPVVGAWAVDDQNAAHTAISVNVNWPARSLLVHAWQFDEAFVSSPGLPVWTWLPNGAPQTLATYTLQSSAGSFTLTAQHAAGTARALVITLARQSNLVNFPYITSGGIVVSGAASLLRRTSIVSSGGLVAGGAAQIIRRASWVPSGGIIASGAAPMFHRTLIIPAGGLISSGAATVVFRLGVLTVLPPEPCHAFTERPLASIARTVLPLLTHASFLMPNGTLSTLVDAAEWKQYETGPASWLLRDANDDPIPVHQAETISFEMRSKSGVIVVTGAPVETDEDTPGQVTINRMPAWVARPGTFVADFAIDWGGGLTSRPPTHNITITILPAATPIP